MKCSSQLTSSELKTSTFKPAQIACWAGMRAGGGGWVRGVRHTNRGRSAFCLYKLEDVLNRTRRIKHAHVHTPPPCPPPGSRRGLSDAVLFMGFLHKSLRIGQARLTGSVCKLWSLLRQQRKKSWTQRTNWCNALQFEWRYCGCSIQKGTLYLGGHLSHVKTLEYAISRLALIL